MAKKTSWQPTGNRFVTFIDIMGFKDLVLRSSHKDIYDLLTEISNIRNYIEKTVDKLDDRYEDAEIYSVSFSDSIILFSKNDSPESFDLQVYSTSYLFARAIEKNIPMKGGIAYGKISLNKSSQIYFGQPLIDAYLLEEEMHYYGVACHHSILDYIYKNESEIRTKKLHLFECPTPLKSGLITHTNINWFIDLDRKINNDKNNKRRLEDVFYEKIRILSTKTSGKPRKYIDNTVNVFNSNFNNIKNK
ncbi:MAG: hypothetical protein KQH79_17440 [Bacteroidetes bacterium]|nr:hypothetical protein [Bacteroidota bacterium]